MHVHGVSESSGSLSSPSSSVVVGGLPFAWSSSDVTLLVPGPGEPDRCESIDGRPRGLSTIDARFCLRPAGASDTSTCGC